MREIKKGVEFSLVLKLLPTLVSSITSNIPHQPLNLAKQNMNSSIYNRHRPGIGQYINGKVRSILKGDVIIKALPITVKTYKGMVELCGFVYDLFQKRRAVLLAQQVKGVRKVKDSLVILKYKA